MFLLVKNFNVPLCGAPKIGGGIFERAEGLHLQAKSLPGCKASLRTTERPFSGTDIGVGIQAALHTKKQ